MNILTFCKDISNSGSCNLYLTSSLESLFDKIFSYGNGYKNVIDLTIEELVFRHLQQKSEFSEILVKATNHIAPKILDSDIEPLKLDCNLLKQGILIKSFPFEPIQKAIDRANKFLLNPSNSSTTAKILLKAPEGDSLRKAYCIAVSLGELTDQPFDQSVWKIDEDFQNSLLGAENLAYQLTGKGRVASKYRKIIPLEPNRALPDIHGSSASAAFLFAHLANIEYGLLSSPNSTFSCSIDFYSVEPSFTSVSHISDKIVAASEAGLKRVFVHADNRLEADKSKASNNLDIEIIPVSGAVKDSWIELLEYYLEGSNKKSTELKYRLEQLEKYKKHPSERDAYNINQVLPLKVREMRKKWLSEYGNNPVDCLVVSVSNSIAVIMAYWVFRPTEMILLCNEGLNKFNEIINLIKENIVETPFISSQSRLKSENFRKTLIDNPDNATAIYNALLSETSLSKSIQKRVKILADITGGLKPMSSALSQFAWQHDIQTVYMNSDKIDNNWVVGSQHFIKVTNPKEILKKEEFEKACELFNEGRYHAAAVRFDELKKETDINKSILNFLINLAKYYSSRMLLNFDGVIKQAGKIRESGLLNTVTISPVKVVDNIKSQLKVALEEDIELFRIYEFYTVAARKHELNDFNTAILIYYRFLEDIVTYKLAEHGIEDTGNPDFSSVLKDMSEEDLLKNLNKELSSIDSWREELDELPSRLGLFMGVAVLTVIDSFASGININANLVKEMYNLADIRNNSVLSHGYTSISEKECEKFKMTADFVLKNFLENKDIDYDRFIAQIDFQEIISVSKIG